MTIATLLFALIAIPANPAGAGEPIMLDFTAEWCGPCRQMRPAIEQLVEMGYPIKPVDMDQSQDLADQYHVKDVPTFVVIDPSTGKELGRTKGYQPASNLASLYNESKAKLKPRHQRRVQTGDAVEARDGETRPGKAAPATPNPEPWETVVRIKVHGRGAIGFGSGTIIASSPEESIILTCAHIFKMDGRYQAPPAKFPLKISIDLFDGNLSGPKQNQVHYTNETFAGEALDYDFDRDVGLIRIRPGRRLPHARVVPPYWKPTSRMGMITVGCSEGHDATAWSTIIVNPAMKGLNGNGTYQAIECVTAPKQGRSGGGLFTSNGYIAGVCDFAEPRGNHGLYAAPSSIYHILDRNDLMALYSPVRSKPETLLAKNRPAPTRNVPYTRGQSPDPQDPGAVTLPPPEMVGIKPPVVAENNERSAGTQRRTWHPTATPAPTASTTDLKLDPSADPDRFAITEPENPTATESTSAPRPAAPRAASGKWRAGRSPLPELGIVQK
jgi:thiol-disulfide isomerase/thioredoxin